MPYITSVHESLPYVDPEPTPEQRAAAEALVAQERTTVPDDPHHALLRPPYESKLTPAMQAEVARVAANQSAEAKDDKKKQTQLSAIDLSRYEVDDDDDDDNEVATTSDAAALRTRLTRAYTSQTYLRGRRAHLALLDSYGKNAWLVGNWQTEADLRALEADLAATRKDIDLVTLRRQRAQNEAAGELRSLDETWRTGVGRVLETEAAAEELRLRILDARRQRAENGEDV
ncbi:pre-mRNA-splicing factor SPF27 [Sporothrix brasiliensis 5110]|uniref:Pre-mRNA-splicing factor SPF27 n=1 Tax=Sporothrix brasiliensis 5110 TaxID=1398154 RepID=A0A0C2ILY9_9PEZI|nr:pre-mRNA-splicing factor SPF27 [Sporothrix brasiliensis 5110]KIH88010.1 pre-mRNA-splicing factor SPF27 [Sporothrix brasiliensis 5110]